MNNNIITGEKIQQCCDIYLGKSEDFNYNPIIKNQNNKHICIDNISDYYDNPCLIFCYSHRIDQLALKICYFKNQFILVTHNSDQNIEPTENVNKILSSNNLKKWYGQNLCFHSDKLHMLPIGFANSMWPHGNLNIFNDNKITDNLHIKSKFIYFNFNINTNKDKRQICYNSLKDKLIWLQNIEPYSNLKRLSQYEFCICPEGNGVDTHRLWECLYLKVVPIVINSPFTQTLNRYNVPLVILDNWSELSNSKLIYNNYNFNDNIFNNILIFNNLIDMIKFKEINI
jgi:hypothetical protein